MLHHTHITAQAKKKIEKEILFTVLSRHGNSFLTRKPPVENWHFCADCKSFAIFIFRCI